MRSRKTGIGMAAMAIILAGCSQAPARDTDDVTEPQFDPAMPTVYLANGAETDPGWTARPTHPGLLYGLDNRPGAGGWHRSAAQARTGSQSWTFQDDETGRYHEQALYDLHLPPVDLTSAKQPVLRFHYRGESESNSGDEFSWEASPTGATFEPLGSTDLPATDWTLVTSDLSAFVGTTVHLVLRFEADWCGAETQTSLVCGPGSGEGYFVDDIEVVEAS